MKVDVAIAGAGPAGLAVAVQAQQSGYTVAVISPEAESRSRTLPETLPASIQTYLCSLGLLKDFLNAGFRRHYCMASVWGSDRRQERHSICAPNGAGWYLNRSIFDRWMLKAVSTRAGITHISGRLRDASLQSSGWQLSVSGSDEPIHAKLMVDATGRAAAFARRIGIRRRIIDRQICITKNFPAFDGCEALLEAAAQGWWFSAPSSPGRLAVAFFTDADLLPRGFRSAGEFGAMLQSANHTCARIKQGTSDDGDAHVASASHLCEFAGEGWFAIGDAAIAYDPLASQGLLHAFGSAEYARQSITQFLSGQTGKAIAGYRSYQQQALQRFLAEREQYYSAERRWNGSPFWQRRSVPSTWPVSQQ